MAEIKCISFLQIKELSDASPKDSLYPYDMIWGMAQVNRSNPFKK